jgi:hypothetical protein
MVSISASDPQQAGEKSLRREFVFQAWRKFEGIQDDWKPYHKMY